MSGEGGETKSVPIFSKGIASLSPNEGDVKFFVHRGNYIFLYLSHEVGVKSHFIETTQEFNHVNSFSRDEGVPWYHH